MQAEWQFKVAKMPELSTATNSPIVALMMALLRIGHRRSFKLWKSSSDFLMERESANKHSSSYLRIQKWTFATFRELRHFTGRGMLAEVKAENIWFDQGSKRYCFTIVFIEMDFKSQACGRKFGFSSRHLAEPYPS